MDFPTGALRAAAKLGGYEFVDCGTRYAVGASVWHGMAVHEEASEANEHDLLLNTAHVLVISKVLIYK